MILSQHSKNLISGTKESILFYLFHYDVCQYVQQFLSLIYLVVKLYKEQEHVEKLVEVKSAFKNHIYIKTNSVLIILV